MTNRIRPGIRKKTIFLFLTAGLLFALFVFGSDSSNGEVVVEMTQSGFATSTVHIRQGDAVVFHNSGDVLRWPATNEHPTHTEYPNSDARKCGTISESLILDSCAPLSKGENYPFRFDEAGVWHVHDHLSPDAGLSVTVEAREGYRKPMSHLVISALADSIRSIEEFFDAGLNFFLVEYARSTNAVPQKPLHGPYSGEDLVTYRDYATADIRSVVKSDLEVMRMINDLGLPKTIERVSGEPAYEYDSASCHTAMHVVGRMAFDLSGFQALSECSTACFSGCYHGALERIATSENPPALFGEAREYCAAQGTIFQRDQCFHGIGHAFMIFSKYRLEDALNQCRTYGSTSEKSSCYSGVIMENYVGDPGIIGVTNPTAPSADTGLHFPCTLFAGDPLVQEWCYKAQPNHFLEVFEGDFARAGEECMNAPESMRGACFMRLGQLSAADIPNPARSADDYCATVPEAYFDECIIGGLRFMIVNPGVDPEGRPALFCRDLGSAEAKEVCYAEYARKLTEMFTDIRARTDICSLFEAPYDRKCLAVQ